MKVVDLARENHVRLLSLSPHSSHQMQPLDKTFMGPLKNYLTGEIRKRHRMQPRPATHFGIVELFVLAYIRAQLAELAVFVQLGYILLMDTSMKIMILLTKTFRKKRGSAF